MTNRLAQTIRSWFPEQAAWLFGPDGLPLPPRKLINGVGGGDYRKIGEEFFRHFTRVGGLQPHHRVLDVGCGCGRMAMPLIPFLTGSGEYHGFDIVPKAVQWSRKHIEERFPRFHFTLAQIYNCAYNSKGTSKPTDYRFGYPDNYFDFAIVTSVFTHLLVREMDHYLSEISRTLKPGGRSLMTFFLLNPEAREQMAGGSTSINFKYPLDRCFTSNAVVPEKAVAYEEGFVRESLARHRLKVDEPVHYGNWVPNRKWLSFQDIVVVTKV